MFTHRSPIILAALLTAIPAAGRLPEPSAEVPAVITSSTPAGTVEFPHAMHATDLEMECVACHHETNAEALNTPHTEYYEEFWVNCKTCHRVDASPGSPQACSACHHSSPTSIADETLSAKVVIHRSCFDCHECGTGQDAARSCGICHRGGPSDIEEPAMKPEGHRDE